MIPRTVQMAAEVNSQFNSQQLVDYGNVILNGYLAVEPNTTNRKAWQYAETTTAPIDLPSVSSVRPALKGWSTNYLRYYTQLQPNGYGVNPGDPTMFEYTVHSFEPLVGPVVAANYVTYGKNYNTNNYSGVATTSSGLGVGATVDFSIDANGYLASFSVNSPGTGYSYGEVLTPDNVGQGGTEPIIFHVTEIDPARGGEYKWAQAPRRFNQQSGSDVTLPQYENNPAVIQYSFLYPIADRVEAPPIGTLS